MPNPYPLRWQALNLQKQGNAAADYEDACAADASRGRFAIADGASEASFAAVWAKLLVEGFIASKGKPWRDLDWITPLGEQWARKVDDLPLPWYGEQKRELGAFATFLGLVFRWHSREEYGYWRGLAAGDCCLFQARGGRLRRSFPLQRSAEFGNRPSLLGSRQPVSDTPPPSRGHGYWRAGDRFLLMTDALAQWFLLGTEQDEQPLDEIQRLLEESEPEAAFPDWIEERREQALLRNDDVTLLVIDIGERQA